MLASIRHEGLTIIVRPGFTWDGEQRVFKGEVLYGDELLTLCITGERMQRSLNAAFEVNANIEDLFHPERWVADAEHPHDQEVYFEEEADLG
ncbi:MAG: hypothetical protein J2P36_03325, partial [Ktedonobacteraceae bacterium]|nr:hypothetical protein [Ktedonobacteraceae bacterium]